MKSPPEHDPETSEAVFRKDHAQTRIQSAMMIQPDLIAPCGRVVICRMW
jgi:hypothetical protein